MIKIDKLYTASSIFKDSTGDKTINIDWCHAGEKWEDANYKDIIKGYKNMDTEERLFAEDYVNKFFAEEEVEFLKLFLEEKLGIELVIEEHSLPIETAYSERLPFDEIGSSFGTIHLNILTNYDLPFKVWGNYNKDDRTTSLQYIMSHNLMRALIMMRKSDW